MSVISLISSLFTWFFCSLGLFTCCRECNQDYYEYEEIINDESDDEKSDDEKSDKKNDDEKLPNYDDILIEKKS